MASAQYDKLHLYIDGEWLGPEGRKTGNVVNPATGDTIGTLPHASKADLDRALDAAARGFQSWRKVSPNERAKVLRKAGELIRERADRIATLMTLEEGKTLGESKMEVLSSAEIFEWMAEECRRSYGRLVPPRAAGHRQMVMREPVGPVAAFSPWNFPAVTPARKIAASLAAGCSCIIKPAEETPATALAMAKPRACSPSSSACRARSRPISSPRRSFARSRSPARPWSASSWPSSPPTASSGQRWNWAATRRSSSSTTSTPTPSPRWRSPPSIATRARSASRRPASMCRRTCTTASSPSSPSSPRRCRSATGCSPRTRWGRSPMPAASTRWSR